MSDETISVEDYQHLVAFYDASMKIAVRMILGKPEPVLGTDEPGGMVHASAHVGASFHHGTHAAAHNAVMYVDRFHQIKKSEDE
jgi:hypothetical protein